VTAVAHERALRTLARHQWVRDHGVPRVSTLVGPPAIGQTIWREWLDLSGRREGAAAAQVEPEGAGDRWLDDMATRALALAVATPDRPIAIVVRAESVRAWSLGRTDRAATFLAEGVIDASEVAEVTDALARELSPEPTALATSAPDDRVGRRLVPAIAAPARSLAEAVLFDALEATEATRGRFALNQAAAFMFGARAAELDLLSHADELVLEVDGYHHFTDPEAYRRDRRKDLLLQAHGYVVLRFLAEDILADPRAAVGAVIELLGLRQGRASRRKGP
jgi:Protein of unknown function (DUF559)